MSANTETTGADRTKCAKWCGKAYGARGVPFRRSCGFPMYFEHGADFNVAVKDDEPTWCSPACRDARLPPIVAPAFEHQALCPVERGGSCNCVPIATPAAHVERRKGQVWRHVSSGYATEWVLDEHRGDRWGCVGVKSAQRGTLLDVCWDRGMMTLLADATPEPAEWDRVIRAAKSPPAQEAPKAAPEQFWFTDDEGEKIGPFATGLEADDASVAYGAWMRTQTGKPYAGPARLPRPQLAADWVEDCLGDVR